MRDGSRGGMEAAALSLLTCARSASGLHAARPRRALQPVPQPAKHPHNSHHTHTPLHGDTSTHLHLLQRHILDQAADNGAGALGVAQSHLVQRTGCRRRGAPRTTQCGPHGCPCASRRALRRPRRGLQAAGRGGGAITPAQAGVRHPGSLLLRPSSGFTIPIPHTCGLSLRSRQHHTAGGAAALRRGGGGRLPQRQGGPSCPQAPQSGLQAGCRSKCASAGCLQSCHCGSCEVGGWAGRA